MNREVHVRFFEGLRVQLPWATHLWTTLLFQAFCETRELAFFRAEPKTIRAFVEHCVEIGKKPATIRRYVATISRAHVAAGLGT
jgi:hypothetical protein